MNAKYLTTARHAAGFSLIEVLISLVILSVGLLGIAAMVATSLKSKDSSYMRTQATALSSAILDRMRANRATATANGYDVALGAVTATLPSCFGNGAACNPTQVATVDLEQWKSDLANLLPSGDGSISTVINSQMTQVTVTVVWSDQRANQATAAATSAAPVAATTSFVVTSGL